MSRREDLSLTLCARTSSARPAHLCLQRQLAVLQLSNGAGLGLQPLNHVLVPPHRHLRHGTHAARGAFFFPLRRVRVEEREAPCRAILLPRTACVVATSQARHCCGVAPRWCAWWCAAPCC